MKLRLVVLFAIIVSIQVGVRAQGTFTAKASNSWNVTGTWTLTSGSDADGIPDANDNVIIPNTFTVDVNVTAACSALTLNGNGVLNFSNNVTLTVGGLMTMNGTSQVTGNNNARILNLTNDFIIPAGQSGSIGGIQVAQTSGRNFTVSGTFTPTSATGNKNIGILNVTGTGTWNSTSNETYNVQNNANFTDGATIDGSSTATINVFGGLWVLAGAGGAKTQLGRISLNVTGTTNVDGYLVFAFSASGTKTFNGTITVNPSGTWDNTIGEDPVVNCNIVNNGLWPVPTGGTGQYIVNSGNSYTYTGTDDIGMTQLSVSGGSTVTNRGRLYLTKNNNNGLSVTGGSTFNNGNGGYLTLTSAATPVNVGFTSTVNFSTASNTVEYAFAGDQDVYATTYYKMVASNGGTKTVGNNSVVNSSLTITGSTVVDVTNSVTLTGTGNLIMTGTSVLKLASSGTLPALSGTSHSLAPGTTINFYDNAAQTAASSTSYPYANVAISGGFGSNVNIAAVSTILGNLTFTNWGDMNSNPVMTVGGTLDMSTNATVTLAANVTLGDFTYSNGTLDFSSRTITINGNNGRWSNDGGTVTQNATSFVTFTTGTNQTITGTNATTFRNLTINNGNGVTLSGQDATVSTALALTSGALITGSNKVIIPSGSSVSRTSGFVQGNLQKYVTTGPTSVTFEVGTGVTYAPVTVLFANVSVAGSLIASTTAGDHPDVNGSSIDPTLTVNRYWTLTNSGTTFTTYSATFNFVAGDKDASVNTSNFQVKRSNGVNWFTTTPGTRAALSTQFATEAAANLTTGNAMDFQIGEIINTTGVLNRVTGANNWNNIDTWIQNRTGTISFTNGSTTVTGTSTLFTTELGPGSVLMLQSSPGTIRGIVQSVTNNTTLVLSANATATISGGYGRKYVPNSNGDIVTIGNSILTDATTAITLDMNATVNALNINTAASPRVTAQTLTHTGANSLTVQTDVGVYQPGAAVTDAWNINAGSATIGGNLTIGSGLNVVNENAQVAITAGTLTVGSNMIFNTSNNAGREATAVVDMTGGAGRLNLGKALIFTNNRGLLKPGTAGSIFNFDRTTSGQSIDFPASNTTAWTYYNVYCNNTSSAGLTISNAISTTDVAGDIRVQTGSLIQVNNSVAGNAGKTFQVATGATFRMTGNQAFPTGFGTFDLGIATPFGTVKYENTNNTAVSSKSYGNLQILGSANFTLPNSTITATGSLVVGDGSNTSQLVGTGASTVLTVTRDITINASSVLNATNMATINIGGNWTNDDTFSAGTNTVNFNGTGPSQPQTIGGAGTEVFYNLTLNTGANTNNVQLSKDASVSRTLTLTQGGLILNSHELAILRNSTAAVARTSGYIKSETTSAYGTVNWYTGTSTGSFVFPFGKSDTEYIPVTLNITGAGSPATGSISLGTYHTATDNTPYPSSVTNLYPGNNSANVADRFWMITANNYTTTRPTSTISLTATAAEVGTITNLQAQVWSAANSWSAPIGGQTNTGVSATVAGVSTYGIWALSGNNSPLPITLLSFNAMVHDRQVDLHWVTATEINNDFFTIESSSDGESFEAVLTVKGAGNSTTKRNYTATDNHPMTGRSYYRLRQTDFDGHKSFSNVVKVDLEEAAVWTVYPNPSDGSIVNVQLTPDAADHNIVVQVYDLSGALALSTVVVADSQGAVAVSLDQRLVPGMYVMQIAQGQTVQRQRLAIK